jgi:hypothetical protein
MELSGFMANELAAFMRRAGPPQAACFISCTFGLGFMFNGVQMLAILRASDNAGGCASVWNTTQ